jgi:uncharacterized protein YbjT (DUF2867 family)
MTRRILLIGATGLVGRLLADRLAGEPVALHGVVRRPTGRTDDNWTESVAPADQWPTIVRSTGGDIAISALGTTWRAAGSEPAFRAVDQEMVVSFARVAREAGARQMILVSSVGADPSARAFYLRVKGETEQALRSLDFPRLDIVRPGLLRGDRGPERRLGERIGIALGPLTNLLLRGRLDRFAPIDADIVAAAVLRLAMHDEPGTFIHHNRALAALARA